MPYIATSRKEVDITDVSSIDNFFRDLNFLDDRSKSAFTHIVNASGYTDVDRAEKESEKAFLLNGKALEFLSLKANQLQAKLVHFSTDYIFEGKKDVYREEDLAQPLNVYGASKKLGEDLLKKHAKSYLLIRTSWLFGGKRDFITKILAKMRKSEKIYVVTDQIGRPTYVGDLAKASLALFPYTGVFHFAGASRLSWYDFAKRIYKVARQKEIVLACKEICPVKTEEFRCPALRPLNSVLNTEKVEKLLNINPQQIDSILETLIER